MQKTIKKSIEINAPKEKVWNVLFTQPTASQWCGVFMGDSDSHGGSVVEGDFSLNNLMTFKDGKGDGMREKVVQLKPMELLRMQVVSSFQNGVEDTSSDEFKKWKDGYEEYVLSDKDGNTLVSIENKLPESYVDMFSTLWDKALAKVKELAEK
jgi:uncharacterized protein YndB with AHSA1/START domain